MITDKSTDKELNTSTDTAIDVSVQTKGKAVHDFMTPKKQIAQPKEELRETTPIVIEEQPPDKNTGIASSDSKNREQTRKKKPTSISYEETFLNRYELASRQGLHIEKETMATIKKIVHGIGDERLTVSGFVENILKHHFEIYEDEIDRLFDEKFRKPFQK